MNARKFFVMAALLMIVALVASACAPAAAPTPTPAEDGAGRFDRCINRGYAAHQLSKRCAAPTGPHDYQERRAQLTGG